MKKKMSTLTDLTWQDLEDWAGRRVVSRGKSYLRNVADLRITDDGQYDEDFDDEEEDAPSVRRGRKTVSSRRGEGQDGDGVAAYLDGLDKDALKNLLMKLSKEIPDARQLLVDQTRTASGRTGDAVKSLRKTIQSLAAEPAWSSHWSEESNIPDYSGVRNRLESLLENGQADAVVEVGKDLLKHGMRQIANSNDEGELGEEIGACMEIALKSLTKSSMSEADQILWEIDARLADDYGIFEGEDGPLSKSDAYSPEVWDQVAEKLSRRMDEKFVSDSEDDDHNTHYQQERIMHRLIDALERSGGTSRIIPLLEREVKITHCYAKLVERLLEERRTDDARQWALAGYAATIEKLPGIADEMKKQLLGIAEANGDRALAASFRTDDFFGQPSLDSYDKLEKAATAAGVWPSVRPAIQLFLETGRRPGILSNEPLPDKKAGKGTSKTKTAAVPSPPAGSATWPLPPLGLPSAGGSRFDRGPEPHFDTLIRLAIREGRTDDILKWHGLLKERNKSSGYWRHHDSIDDTVAEAVKDAHPDFALGIWRGEAERFIGEANPKGYEAAAPFLRKMNELVASQIGDLSRMWA